MANIKPDLRTAILNDPAICDLFFAAGAEPKCLPSSQFTKGRLPVIAFDEDDNVPYLTGDARELVSEVIVTIHIFVEGSTNAWLDAVDNVMRTKFRAKRVSAPELVETKNGVNIYHRAARYRCLVSR